MASETRNPGRSIVWLEMRRATRNPGIVLNDLLMGVTCVFLAVHPAADEPLFLTLRLAFSFALIGVGAIIMAELNAKDLGLTGMIMERGAYREASLATLVAHVALWQILILPSLAARLWKAPDAAADTLLQALVLLASSVAVAATVQLISATGTRRGWFPAVGWIAPVLVIVFLALYVTAGLGLAGFGATFRDREWIALVYSLAWSVPALLLLLRSVRGIPRRKHARIYS